MVVRVTKIISVMLIITSLTRSQKTSNDAVRFPGLVSPSMMRVSAFSSFTSSKVRPCEGNADFCDFAADYPRDIVPDPRFQGASLIKGKIFSSGSFDSSVNDVPGTKRFNIGGFGERKERACKVRRDIIYPQKARNSQGDYLFIVNQDTFRQAVEVEQCVNEGSECLTDSDAPSSGSTVCRQEFATHRLYATSGNGEQVYDSFSLPSACLCHFRDNFGLKSGFVSSGTKGSSGPRSQLPTCRAGIQLNLPTTGDVKPAQISRPPQPLSQNFRDPSLVSNAVGGGRTQPNRRPRPAEPPASLSQNFRDPSSPGNSNRRTDNGGRTYYSGGRSRSFLGQVAQQQKRPRRQFQYRRRGRRFYQRRSKRQTQTCSSTFCDRTRDYPTQSVLQQLLRKPEVSGQLFNNVFNSECVRPETKTRQFNINEDQLCRSRKKVIFPQKALNSENNWMFVVNVANFTQSVEIDECQGFGFGDGDDEVFGSCLYSGSQGNDPGSTSCRQLYRQHRLLALNGANKLEVDSFKLPSACACFTASNPFPEFRSSRPRQG